MDFFQSKNNSWRYESKQIQKSRKVTASYNKQNYIQVVETFGKQSTFTTA